MYVSETCCSCFLLMVIVPCRKGRVAKCESEQSARAQTIRKVTIAIAYRQTTSRNSNVDIIRYDRKFPVRSIDRLIKTRSTPAKWNLLYCSVTYVNRTEENMSKNIFFYSNFIRYFIQKWNDCPDILFQKELKFHALYTYSIF